MSYDELKLLVDEGLTQRAIAKRLNKGQSTVKYWLKKFSLYTTITNSNKVYNLLSNDEKQIRRKKQVAKSVIKKRRKIKQFAIEYKGGKCKICGYDRCVAAMHFHHLDSSKKNFNISQYGYSRSWEKVRPEIDKCILVCANCHSEIHEGLIDHLKVLLI